MTKYTKQDQQLARSQLANLKPGDTVYTVMRHRSQSGMYRAIDLYVMEDCEPRRITWSACTIMGQRYDTRHEAAGISGCGMDMGFALVYDLSYYLFPDGFPCVGDRCPSNDHSNGLNDYTPGANHHKSGGYALNHRWL